MAARQHLRVVPPHADVHGRAHPDGSWEHLGQFPREARAWRWVSDNLESLAAAYADLRVTAGGESTVVDAAALRERIVRLRIGR
jgi:hypothetical protein